MAHVVPGVVSKCGPVGRWVVSTISSDESGPVIGSKVVCCHVSTNGVTERWSSRPDDTCVEGSVLPCESKLSGEGV